MAAEAPRAQAISINEALEASVDWLKKNWWRTLIVSALSFAVAWLWNMWLMAYRLEGHRVDPGRGSTTATADGKSYNLIYWLLVTTVGFGLIAYARERGVRTTLQELAGAPKRILGSLTAKPNATVAMFLWGMSLSMIVAVILTQAMSGVLAIGFIVAAPSLFANLINNFFIRVWTAVLSNFAPQLKDEVEGIASPLTVMLGQAAGMILAFVIGDDLFGGATPVVKVLLALGFAGLSYVVVIVSNRPSPSAAATVVMIVGAAGALVVLLAHPTAAFADDGGWKECTYNGHACNGIFGFYQWFRSHGATIVIKRAFIGGFGAGFGAILGATLGGTVGSLSNALSAHTHVGGPQGGQPAQSETQVQVQTQDASDSSPQTSAQTAGDVAPQPGQHGVRMFDDVLPDADKVEEEVGEAAPGGVAGGVAGGEAGALLGGGPRMFDDVLPDADKVEDEADGGDRADGADGADEAGEDATRVFPAPVEPVDAAVDEEGGGPGGPKLLDDVLPDADKVEEEEEG